MNFSQEQLNELKNILEEDYEIELTQKDLFGVACSLVGYFDLLAKIDNRDKIKNNKQLIKNL